MEKEKSETPKRLRKCFVDELGHDNTDHDSESADTDTDHNDTDIDHNDTDTEESSSSETFPSSAPSPETPVDSQNIEVDVAEVSSAPRTVETEALMLSRPKPTRVLRTVRALRRGLRRTETTLWEGEVISRGVDKEVESDGSVTTDQGGE